MIEERCANHVCIVLTGETQGQFKTSWLDNLCPKILSNYLITGKIDPENQKDMNMLISTKFLINIDDQLKELNRKNENALKTFITVDRAEYRRVYATFSIIKPHFASFMASVNGKDFLADTTGTRRFLPFEVLEIDINKAQSLDLDKVYAQAYQLFQSGFRYWFDKAEIDIINENNKEFKIYTAEYELVSYYLSPAQEDDLQSEFMNTTQLKVLIETLSFQKLNKNKMGSALKELGFKAISKRVNGNPIYGYYFFKKEGSNLTGQYLEKKGIEPDPF